MDQANILIIGGGVVGCAIARELARHPRLRIAPAPGADLTPASLRQRLGRHLPVHMLPARWMAFDRLPRNGNGKIDRASLKLLFERHETVATRES